MVLKEARQEFWVPVLSNSCNVRMVPGRRQATGFQILRKQLFRNWLHESHGYDMSSFDLLRIATKTEKYTEISQ